MKLDYIIVKYMAQRCGVIDSGYRGEWFVPITNTSDYAIRISKKKYSSQTVGTQEIVYPYAKAIAQAIIVHVPHSTVRELPYKRLAHKTSIRGMGSLGSTEK